MRHYKCTCGNVLFFENSACLQCGTEVGYDVTGDHMVALTPDANFQRCANGIEHGVCNWALPAGDGKALCPSCDLNRIIPDLSLPGNREAWHKIEIAKRRNLYTLARLGLSPVSKKHDSVHGMAFDFLRP